MPTNKDVLVQAFESAPDIAGRYKNLYCVNFRPGMIRKARGGISLVFRAIDTLTGDTVAIKIMDPDFLADLYRMDCFEREPKILQAAQGIQRCLRLVDGLVATPCRGLRQSGATARNDRSSLFFARYGAPANH